MRQNRQKLVDAGKDPHIVAGMSNKEVHDALARETIKPAEAPAAPAEKVEPSPGAKPEVASIEHIGKKELAIKGVGQAQDQYQVKLKGEEGRGRTMTKADMDKEGIDTSNLPGEKPAQTQPAQENAVPKQSPSKVPVQPKAGNGEGVGVENAVDQGAPGARQGKQAKGPKAVREKAVEGTNVGTTPLVAEMVKAAHGSLAKMRDKVSNVRLGKPGEILFEFDGKTHSAPESKTAIVAQDTKGTNDPSARSWALKQILDNKAKPVRAVPEEVPAPVTTEKANGDKVVSAPAAAEQRVSQLATPKQIKVQKQFLKDAVAKAAADAKPESEYAAPPKATYLNPKMAPKPEAAKDPGKVTFDVPGDGEYKIRNTKEALAEFNKRLSHFGGAELKPPTIPSRAVPRLTPGEIAEHKVEPGKETPTEAAKPRTSDKVIAALKNAKIHKPGTTAVATPFSIAYDAALDAAIMAIRGGRAVADVIKFAVDHFKQRFPGADEHDIASLEKDIRDAHGETAKTASAAMEAGKPATPPAGEKPAENGETKGAEKPPDYGIAARVTEGRAAKGHVEEVEPGEGISPQESIAKGRELLKKGGDPDKALSDFTKTGKISSDDMAIVRAHGEKLAWAANAALDKFGRNSKEYESAAKADSDWVKAIKPMQTEWHKIGAAQQGETEIDTGTFHGLRRAYTEATGKDFTPDQADKADKIAGKVKKAADEADAARDKVFEAIKDQVEPRETPPKTETPKPPKVDTGRLTKYFADRAAEARQRIRDRAAGKVASSNALLADIGDRAIIAADYIARGINEVGRFAKEWRREFGNTSNQDIAKIFKDGNDEYNKGVENIVSSGVKTVSAKERAAKHTNDVWGLAKKYIDAGETSFDDVRTKVATELGLPVDEVTRQLAEPKSLRTITNEMYSKMSARRNVIRNAKNWLENQQTPGWLRAIHALPRAAFKIATFGHGSVGVVTHAAVNAFNPGAWGTYFPNFFRQFKMMGLHDSGAYHEAMLQNLVRDPNFTLARRSGLANDPTKAQGDYEKAWVGPFLGRIGLTGVRGFDTLKLFRQDRFNQLWEKLPQNLQNPKMAKLLATSINHATGIVGGMMPPGASTAFFAPKLEVSRWAFMAGDQAKAGKTILNWRDETPEARQSAIATVKQFATITGTYASLLAINQGLLSATGSNQKINFTNPKAPDFLDFKAAGYRGSIVSPMKNMVRLFAELIHDSVGQRTTFEQLQGGRADEMDVDAMKYVRQKLSPIAADVADVASQADFAKRPLPFSNDKIPPYLAREGIGKYTYPEYLTERLSPIPVSEAAREVWAAQGMDESDIEHWMRALTTAAVMGSTGARMEPDRETQPKPERPTRRLFESLPSPR